MKYDVTVIVYETNVFKRRFEAESPEAAQTLAKAAAKAAIVSTKTGWEEISGDYSVDVDEITPAEP